jgi:hypothetical protein
LLLLLLLVLPVVVHLLSAGWLVLPLWGLAAAMAADVGAASSF